MKRKYWWMIIPAVLLVSAFLLGVTGVADLQKETRWTPPGEMQDHFCGFFLTWDYLYEQKGFPSEADRVYAESVTTVTEYGYSEIDLVFPDLEGIRFFFAELIDPDYGEPFSAIIMDESICDVWENFHTIDENQEEITVEGTLFCTEQNDFIVMNSVYCDDEGRYYVTPYGSFPMRSGEKSSFSQSEEKTTALNGETVKEKLTVKLTTELKSPAPTVEVLEMSGENVILEKHILAVDALPSEFSVRTRRAGRTE